MRYEYNKSLDPYKLNYGDIIMCITGRNVGKNTILDSVSNDYYTNQRIATIKINSNFISKFVYYCINSPYIQMLIQNNKNSTK